jgi:hypothetical protein
LPQTFPFLKGGSNVREDAATQSAILNALLPNQGPPLTFCAVNRSKLEIMKPWAKAFTLQDLAEAGKKEYEDDGYISPQDLMCIVFQIIWTLGVLQDKFPGYQHNSLSKSIRLYSYGASRCYKIRDRDGSGGHVANGTAFYIRKFLPLPVIVSWNTSNCLVRNIDVPFRSDGSKPSQDLNDVLKTILEFVDLQQCPQFIPLDRMLSECTLYYTKLRRTYAPTYELLLQDKEELYFDKVETGENLCVPQILALECPDGYNPLPGKMSEMLLCGKCPKTPLVKGRNPDTNPEIIPDPAGGFMCSNGLPLVKTDKVVSKYFNDFLYPLEITQNGYAIVDGF